MLVLEQLVKSGYVSEINNQYTLTEVGVMFLNGLGDKEEDFSINDKVYSWALESLKSSKGFKDESIKKNMVRYLQTNLSFAKSYYGKHA